MVPVQYKQIHHKRNFYGALQKLLLVVIIVVKVVKADFFRLGGTTINGPSRWGKRRGVGEYLVNT